MGAWKRAWPLLILAGVFSCKPPPEERVRQLMPQVNKLIAAARTLESEGKLDDAIKRWKEIIRLIEKQDAKTQELLEAVVASAKGEIQMLEREIQKRKATAARVDEFIGLAERQLDSFELSSARTFLDTNRWVLKESAPNSARAKELFEALEAKVRAATPVGWPEVGAEIRNLINSRDYVEACRRTRVYLEGNPVPGDKPRAESALVEIEAAARDWLKKGAYRADVRRARSEKGLDEARRLFDETRARCFEGVLPQGEIEAEWKRLSEAG